MAGGNSYVWAEKDVDVVKQSTICGRIVDASKQILPGASIYIEKLQTGVTSDVNKVVTSDMDGDAIGGAINLVTKSTPYKRVISTLDGKHQLGKLGMDWAVSYSRATEDRPDERYFEVAMKGKKNKDFF